jgi:hypothetical protein
MMTTALCLPRRSTSPNRVSAFSGDSRTQPCEAVRPRRWISGEPWMAWPRRVKKIEFGMGA